MMLCSMTLSKFWHFLGPYVIFDGPTICQYINYRGHCLNAASVSNIVATVVIANITDSGICKVDNVLNAACVCFQGPLYLLLT